MSKIILNYLRIFAISITSITIFLIVTENKIVPNEADAQCVDVGLPGTLCGLSHYGTTSLCNGVNPRSGCPSGYSQVAWSDNGPGSDSVFSCRKN